MNGTYHLNQETQRLELHFPKADYTALSDADKRDVKSTCLFSRYADAWVSRTQRPFVNAHHRAVELAKRLGLTEQVAEGEKLTPSELQERTQERALERADRSEDRARKNEQLSSSLYEQSRDKLSVIPMGQPILVGHHSERGHRALLGRADNLMRGSVQAAEKADYYADKAKVAERTASAPQLRDAAFLTRRVKEHTASLRKMQRGAKKEGASESTIAHYTTWAAHYQEKVAYYTELLASVTGFVQTKETLQEQRAGYVLYGRDWYPILRLNAQTVTVGNWLGIASFDWKVPYAEIKGVRPVDAPELVLDREGSQVLPKVKY